MDQRWWFEMKEVALQENPENGTSGLSSALQLVESTSSITIQFGTAPSLIIYPFIEDVNEIERDETFNETLRRVIKKHRNSLDILAE